RLVELAPPRIVYISCDPATMARDLIELSKAYKIESVTPVDMFPWTNHCESVVLMSRA
ncbi:MAG: 23S rRNA (uracil-5-)-methyltransferase RumA, partial [Clostridiaceae bacterium]|nr:23S rRNA (uracil-5-)-methyltransferase RumA [Clostridiaceae bacterium]